MSTMKSQNPKQKQVNRKTSQIRLRIQHLLASWGSVSKHRILEPDRIWKSRTPAVSSLSLVSFFSLPLVCCRSAGAGKVVRPSGPDIHSIAGLHTERPIKNQHSRNWFWPLGAGSLWSWHEYIWMCKGTCWKAADRICIRPLCVYACINLLIKYLFEKPVLGFQALQIPQRKIIT